MCPTCGQNNGGKKRKIDWKKRLEIQFHVLMTTKIPSRQFYGNNSRDEKAGREGISQTSKNYKIGQRSRWGGGEEKEEDSC